MRVPWMRSATLPAFNTKYNLYTLLKVSDPTLPRKCQACQVQLDVGAGGAHLFIGNTEATNLAIDNGADLVASQAFSIPSLSSNLIVLDDVVVQTDTNGGVRINVTVIGR